MGDEADWLVSRYSDPMPNSPRRRRYAIPYSMEEMQTMRDEGEMTDLMRAFFGRDDLKIVDRDAFLAKHTRPAQPRNGGSPMATKSRLETEQEKLERMLTEAQAQAARVAELADQAESHPEPGDGMVVYFSKTFTNRYGEQGKEYEFASIRANGKWFHTGHSDFLLRKLPSPCSWEQIVDFADEISVVVEYAQPDKWGEAFDKTVGETEAKLRRDLDGTQHELAQSMEREKYLRDALDSIMNALNTQDFEPRITKRAIRLIANTTQRFIATHDAKVKEAGK